MKVLMRGFTGDKDTFIYKGKIESLDFSYFATFRWVKLGKEEKNISILGLLSCQLTSAGRVALVVCLAGTDWLIAQKAIGRSQFFSFPTFIYMSSAK